MTHSLPQTRATQPEDSHELPEQKRLDRGKDALRDAMRWLIAAYAAVGALLFTGLSLSSIGGLEGANFAWALAGVILAFSGVAIALVSAVTVITAGTVVLEEVESPRKAVLGFLFGNTNKALASAIKRSPSLMGDYAELSQLVSDIHEPPGLREEARKELEADQKPDAKKQNELVKVIQEQNERARRATAATDRLIPNLSYLAVRHRFRIALVWAVLAIVIAGAGLIVFARAANPSDATEVTDGPAVPVTVSLTQEGTELLNDVLGQGCGVSPVSALATESGANEEEPDLNVVTMPRGQCSALAFRLTEDVGQPARLCQLSIEGPSGQGGGGNESRMPIPPRDLDVSAPITLCP